MAVSVIKTAKPDATHVGMALVLTSTPARQKQTKQ
jgi:hypothetical protein